MDALITSYAPELKPAIHRRDFGVVDDAESVLDRIGEESLTEAAHLGGALGALRALHLKEMAGDIPLDQIEHVADRILEVYHEDSEVLRKLVESIRSDDAT